MGILGRWVEQDRTQLFTNLELQSELWFGEYGSWRVSHGSRIESLGTI